MRPKKKDCARELLAATNPWSVHRKSHVLMRAVVFAILVSAGVAALLYYWNRGHP